MEMNHQQQPSLGITPPSPWSLRRLGVMDTLDRALSLYCSRAIDLYLPIAALMYLPFCLERYIIPMPEPEVMGWYLLYSTPHMMWQDILPSFAHLLLHLESHIDAVVTAWGQAAVVYAVAELYVNRQHPDAKSCFQYAASVAWKVSLLRLVWGGVALGLASLIFGFCIAMEEVTSWVLFPRLLFTGSLLVEAAVVSIPMSILVPVLTIERGSSLREGIERIWTLANENRGYIFTSTFVMAILSFFSFVVTGFITQGRGGVFVSSLPFLIFDPLKSILVTVVYLGIRTEKEGLTIEWLEAELADSSRSRRRVGLVEQLIANDNNQGLPTIAKEQGVELFASTQEEASFDKEML